MALVDAKHWMEQNISNVHARRAAAGIYLISWSFFMAAMISGFVFMAILYPWLMFFLIIPVIYYTGQYFLW